MGPGDLDSGPDAHTASMLKHGALSPAQLCDSARLLPRDVMNGANPMNKDLFKAALCFLDLPRSRLAGSCAS